MVYSIKYIVQVLVLGIEKSILEILRKEIGEETFNEQRYFRQHT